MSSVPLRFHSLRFVVFMERTRIARTSLQAPSHDSSSRQKRKWVYVVVCVEVEDVFVIVAPLLPSAKAALHNVLVCNKTLW